MTVHAFEPAVTSLVDTPDVPLGKTEPPSPGDASFAGALGKAFADAGDGLERAARAERAFASGRGGLQEMVLERAQAGVALSIASAAASRTAQSLSTILGMQV